MERPWTTDPYLAKYRFCNVRRRHDRVSEWIRLNVIEPHRTCSHLLQWLALARFVNWPPTLKMLLDNGHGPKDGREPRWSAIARLLDYRHEQGVKTWTGAYMVRAERQHGKKGTYVCEVALHGLFRDTGKMAALGIALAEERRQAVHSVLMSGYGWGSFMAGQVVDDLTWTPLLENAKDHYTWAPQGPGSVRGANRLLGEPLSARIHEQVWQELLQRWRAQVISQLGTEYEDMTLMDLQNCLCEFDKYERVRLGEGRPRSMYKPEMEY